MFHKIKSVSIRPEYVLSVSFADGLEKIYDMKPLMDKFDCYQAFRTTPGLFALASVDTGGRGVSWNEDIDIDGEELWHNGQSVR